MSPAPKFNGKEVEQRDKELERALDTMRQAKTAIEEGRRGDALRILRGYLNPHGAPAPAPTNGGGRAA